MNSKNKRPNIVMIVEDHMAYYGHKEVKTPFFNRLKQEGVSFDRAYCTAPLCCPSRKSLLTGLCPHNHGQTDNSFDTPVNSHETYIDVLLRTGYKSYYFGKWHAGGGMPADLGCRGISAEGYGNPYRQPEYLDYIKANDIPPAVMLVEKNLGKEGWIDEIKEGKEYGFSREMANEALSGILQGPKESHEAFYLSDLACRQLEQLKENADEAPFMLRVDFWGPHQPYHPTREYANLYPPERITEYPSFSEDLSEKPDSYRFDTARGNQKSCRLSQPNAIPWSEWQKILSRCYGQITLVDEAAGKIVDKLIELELDRDTLIIWTADHGDAIACHGGHFDKACYLPEEVLRIPLVMSMPERFNGKKAVPVPVSNADIPVTILAAAGLKFRKPVDGVNLLPYLAGDGNPDRAVMAETFGHLEPWSARAVMKGDWKYIWNEGDMEELYHLPEDPYELHNLTRRDGYRYKLAEMRNLLKELQEKTGDNSLNL